MERSFNRLLRLIYQKELLLQESFDNIFSFFNFCGQREYLWSVEKVAVIGFILCRLGNLIFSVRLVRGGKSPSQTKWTGTSLLLLPVSPVCEQADLTDGLLMLKFILVPSNHVTAA